MLERHWARRPALHRTRPRFDFGPPGEITGPPLLSEQAKNNILGLSAAPIFHLDPTPVMQL